MDEMNILEKQMLENLENLKKMNVECYKYKFDFTYTIKELIEKQNDLLDKDLQIKIAGRIVSERKHGKVIFWDIKDQLDKIQLYIKKDVIGENKFNEVKFYDIGDIIGVTGKLFKTHSGELTIFVQDVEILSKALKPLPEKFHGLKDIEIRYRKRYLDLIVNDDSKKVFFKRTEIINGIRDFLNSNGFIEVETPILQPIYGGAFAQPFITHHNAHDMTLYLRIANELYLKRLIVGGINRVYEFAKDFRNEGIDRTHNPEFTQVEFYQAYADYNDMMELVENMFLKLVPQKKIVYQNQEISFEKPWKRVDFYDSLNNIVGEDLKNASVEKL
ncbi:MAG: amino acid--tRNA ligase-related protein, partial [candidate division WOR-3 bacterium]